MKKSLKCRLIVAPIVVSKLKQTNVKSKVTFFRLTVNSKQFSIFLTKIKTQNEILLVFDLIIIIVIINL